MSVHDDESLDAELELLRNAPAPRAALRQHVLAAVARERSVTGPGAHTLPRARGKAGMGAILAALWRELGGTRLAAPAFALALACGIGMSWLAEDSLAADEAAGEDLVALAQFDDAYEGLEP